MVLNYLFFVGYCCESKMTMVSKNIMTGDGVCTHGYFISKSGINKILSTILPVDLPIDVKMRTFYNKLNVYFSREKCIINRSLEKIDEFKSNVYNI
jgi:hypothetical protein